MSELPDDFSLRELKRKKTSDFLNLLYLWGIGFAAITTIVDFFSENNPIAGFIFICIISSIFFSYSFFKSTIFESTIPEKPPIDFSIDITPAKFEGLLQSNLIPDLTNPLDLFNNKKLGLILISLIDIVFIVIFHSISPLVDFIFIAILNVSLIQIVAIWVGQKINTARFDSTIKQSKEYVYFAQNYMNLSKILPSDTLKSLKFHINVKYQRFDVILEDTKLIINDPTWQNHGIKSLYVQAKITPHMTYPYLVLLCEKSRNLVPQKLHNKHFNTNGKYETIFEVSSSQDLDILVARLDIQTKNEIPSVSFSDVVQIGQIVMHQIINPILKHN